MDEETQRLRRIERNKPLVALLDSWLEEELTPEEEEEQRRSFQEFIRGIDEHRTVRKLFTDTPRQRRGYTFRSRC